MVLKLQACWFADLIICLIVWLVKLSQFKRLRCVSPLWARRTYHVLLFATEPYLFLNSSSQACVSICIRLLLSYFFNLFSLSLSLIFKIQLIMITLFSLKYFCSYTGVPNHCKGLLLEYIKVIHVSLYLSLQLYHNVKIVMLNGKCIY